MTFNRKPAIAHARAMVALFDKCSPRFARRWSYTELWTIYRAWTTTDQRLTPEQWRPGKLQNVLATGVYASKH